jgi:hypothetical protein
MGKAKGISGLVLLPAQEYEWELKGRHQIIVPLKGKISDVLTEDELEAGFKIAGDDDFSIFEDDVFLLWELVRVLFAEAKYPALSSNQCFNVVALEVEGDSLIVHGEVIESVGD